MTIFSRSRLRVLDGLRTKSDWREAWSNELLRLARKRGRKPPGALALDELTAWGLTEERQLLADVVTLDIDAWELWRWAERTPSGKLKVWAELVHREGFGPDAQVRHRIKFPLKLAWTRESDPYPRFFVAGYWVQKAIRSCSALMKHLEASGLFDSIKSARSGLVFARLVMAVAGNQLHNDAGELDELDRLEVAHLTRCSLADRAELLAVITKREHLAEDELAEASAA